MKPIVTLKKIRNPKSHNPYGYERIHIIQFNFDGKGSALIRFNDENELNSFYGKDLYLILFGHPGTGDRWYLPA